MKEILNKTNQEVNTLYNKYYTIINEFPKINSKTDAESVLILRTIIVDTAINYLTTLTINNDLKGYSMIVLYKQLPCDAETIHDKFQYEENVIELLNEFITYFNENHENHIKNIELFSDEFDRDYPMILDFITKKMVVN
jgi:hypothetical protein